MKLGEAFSSDQLRRLGRWKLETCRTRWALVIHLRDLGAPQALCGINAVEPGRFDIEIVECRGCLDVFNGGGADVAYRTDD